MNAALKPSTDDNFAQSQLDIQKIELAIRNGDLKLPTLIDCISCDLPYDTNNPEIRADAVSEYIGSILLGAFNANDPRTYLQNHFDMWIDKAFEDSDCRDIAGIV